MKAKMEAQEEELRRAAEENRAWKEAERQRLKDEEMAEELQQMKAKMKAQEEELRLAAEEKRAREEAERRRRREAEARAEQDRREVEAKEQEAAAYADLQRGRAVVGKPIRVQREGGAGLPIGWQEVVDAASGNTYYFHAGTNASQWGRPGCIGRVTEFNEYEGKHKVAYTDGESKWLFLTEYSEVSEAEMQAEVAAIRGE